MNRLVLDLWKKSMNRYAKEVHTPYKGTKIAFLDGGRDVLEWNGEEWIEIEPLKDWGF